MIHKNDIIDHANQGDLQMFSLERIKTKKVSLANFNNFFVVNFF